MIFWNVNKLKKQGKLFSEYKEARKKGNYFLECEQARETRKLFFFLNVNKIEEQGN